MREVKELRRPRGHHVVKKGKNSGGEAAGGKSLPGLTGNLKIWVLLLEGS